MATHSAGAVSKAQARRDVDAALGVVRHPRAMPQVHGFDSYGARLAIRVAWHARYFRDMPAERMLRAMRPRHLSIAEAGLVVEYVRRVAEREGWLG
jgi:hypothetical protein